MDCPVRLVLAIHNHQPVGNFDGVFEEAYRDSYAPFLEMLAEFPQLSIALHTSGSLMEWLVQAHPEYIDRLRSLVERGQVEILGGPYYEPILACIPRRDRIGQIRAYSRSLEQMFGTTVRGMWVPERVWEQSFAGDITEAGIEYTVLDDFHFRSSGLRDHELNGYYLSEDEGRVLKIFPGSERLRYTIPFQDPSVTIDYLRQIGDASPGAVVVFGDDGEKFGTWPGTKQHVYQNGWLRRMFESLAANADWLRVSTMAEAVDHTIPSGRIYLGDASYREMTEWALTTDRQLEFHELTHAREHDPGWNTVKPYLRGGFWRNFRVKYSESNEMYARMLEVSRKLEKLADSEAGREQPDRVATARSELYRGQCNCPYWHGAFGGLYLPHLRNAIYKHLIRADNILESLSGQTNRWVTLESSDFNMDARKEVRLASDRLVAYIAPAAGGHLYELDVRSTGSNLLATLDRRPEPYHERIRAHFLAQEIGEEQSDAVASIHDRVHFKQPDLDKQLNYDHWNRKSLVDHFLQPQLGLADFQAGQGHVGDFVNGVYETVLRRSADRMEVRMQRAGHVGPYPVTVVKTVAIERDRGGDLEITYELSNLPQEVPLHFGVEFNFAGMAAAANDRYYYDASGRQLGQLGSVQDVGEGSRLGLIDEWLGVDVSLDVSHPAGFWAFPIQTVSQSEGGFELVHQSSAVVPHWEFVASEDGRWSVTIVMSVDTSAAQARQLRETVVSR